MNDIAQKWEPPQWWLISNETVENLKQLLDELPEGDAEDIRHEFLTGLWVTDIAPANINSPTE